MNKKGLAPLLIIGIVLLVAGSSAIVIKNVVSSTGNAITGNVIDEGNSGSENSDSNSALVQEESIPSPIVLNTPTTQPRRMGGSVGRIEPVVSGVGGY